jgi:uncharacterized protein with GYD domain
VVHALANVGWDTLPRGDQASAMRIQAHAVLSCAGHVHTQALAALTRQVEDREQGFRALVERLGGRLVSFFWAQGDYDLVVTVELPGAESANALALAAISPGHARAYRTTPLFTNAETMRAMSRAGELHYRTPGQTS